jgi:hypothetical protein
MSVATSTAETDTGTVRTPDDHVIVLFGATGDLARRKLLPGLFHLSEAGLMPDRFRIICTSRRELADDEFRELARAAVDEFGREPTTSESWDAFAATLSSAGIGEGFGALSDAVAGARKELGGEPRLLHYLSVPPGASATIVEELGEAGLNEGARIIMEKPFGTDLASARELNERVLAVFDESQVFRIDHYLGREAVQNLLAVRFANGMFEPVWNRDHIDHIQIDVPETLSIGTRASFYERIGAFRDMVVTHLFQVLGFVAMEPPTSLDAKTLAAEKTKVFESMPPIEPDAVVRGQYEGYRGPVLPADRKAPRREPSPAHGRLHPAAAPNVPAQLPLRGGGVRARSPHLRARRSGQHLDELPGQGSGPDPPAGGGAHALQLRDRVRWTRAGARGLRAPDPRRDARRPHAVHDLGCDRERVGGVATHARGSAPRAASRDGVLGAAAGP